MVPLLDVLFLLFHAIFTSTFLQANVGTYKRSAPASGLETYKMKNKIGRKNTSFTSHLYSVLVVTPGTLTPFTL